MYALVITGVIFFTALYMSNTFNDRRIAELQDIEGRISTDIIALETQFALLEGLSCEALAENSVLSQELNSLERRLAFTEGQLGVDNPKVLALKKSYSLLQIKDYLLMKKVSEKCGLDPIFIFYFYTNEGNCDDCIREGYVLTFLREQYPRLRVYSFDYNLDLSALRTLIAINEIKNELPALVINEEVYYGFQGREEIESVLPIEDLREPEEESATSTDKKN